MYLCQLRVVAENMLPVFTDSLRVDVNLTEYILCLILASFQEAPGCSEIVISDSLNNDATQIALYFLALNYYFKK